MRNVKLGGVSAIALTAAAVGLMLAAPAQAQDDSNLRKGSEFDKKYSSRGSYMSGDFHNHTTCSDGSTSVQTLVGKSLTYLDWFVQSGHSGNGARDCRFDDFAYDADDDGQGKLWEDTVGIAAIKGNPITTTSTTGRDANGNPRVARAMWRWQSMQEFQFPTIVEARLKAGKPAFAGFEWTVPGHEHTSMSVIAGQYARNPNAAALAQFEYCFAAPSDDTSQGGGQGWTCGINADNNAKLVKRFSVDPVNQGPADYNASLSTQGINVNDTGDHVKSTAAVFWIQQNYPRQGYTIPAHIERAGPFRSGANAGYNVEHLRDWNNASPDVAFGFESQPGHQASNDRGEYFASRNGSGSAGLYTFGGTGCYAGAEAARPGKDFEGNALTAADFLPTGRFPEVFDTAIPDRVVVCRPGIRTMWDALLSEGRRWWFFASSDWHNRGSFAPFDEQRRSDNDFWPGEYQKTYAFVRKSNDRSPNPSQDIVNALRSGNIFSTTGQLIDDVEFKACSGIDCATMGETLKVRKGADIKITLRIRDPKGVNQSPYSFNNPALLQIGVKQPLNKPEVAQVDLIQGDVHDIYDPVEDFDAYRNPLAPETTKIAKSWTASKDGWSASGEWKTMTYTLRAVGQDKYVRARGSNLPAGTPNKRDANGNALLDVFSNNIACADPACPPHVAGKFDADVESWGDLSFHTNPIFIEVQGYQRPKWVRWWQAWLSRRG